MPQITFPPFAKVIRLEPTLEVPGQINRSVWTGRSKIIGLPGSEFWRFTVGLRATVTERRAREMRAFLTGLRGMGNYFHLPVTPNRQATANPNGSLTANVLAGARTVSTSGIADAVPGMFFTLMGVDHHRLVVAQSGTGASTLVFEPPLTHPMSTGMGIEAWFPYARVRLADPRTTWSEENGVMNVGLSVEEAL
jgi:hypothetical protein